MKVNLIAFCVFYIPSFICLGQGQDVGKVKIPFDLHFDVQTVEEDSHCLTFLLELDEGQYAVSAFSEDGFYLPITISWLTLDVNFVPGRLDETPTTVYEYDKIVEKQVRFVKQNTTYEQYFNWKASENAIIRGRVKLLVEPVCIPFDVHFELVSKDGEVSVNKISTLISPEYKL